jgi:hypothetical protein
MLAGLQASLQDADSFAAFPGSELLGYFQTVPIGTKTLSSTMLISLVGNISYLEKASAILGGTIRL